MKMNMALGSISVNFGKLKADAVSRVFSSITRHPIFWGLSPIPWQTPKLHHVGALDNRRRSST